MHGSRSSTTIKISIFILDGQRYWIPATLDDLVDFQYNLTKLNLIRKIRRMRFHPNQGGFFATYHRMK